MLRVVGALLVASPLPAAPLPVALGQITARAGKDRARIAAELRKVLSEELAALDLGRVAARERWVLSASVVRLETRATAEGSESTCVISATLERAGALHAVVRGSARALDAPAGEAESSALRAAARGALRRLPEALR
jgi:hypothetical protein